MEVVMAGSLKFAGRLGGLTLNSKLSTHSQQMGYQKAAYMAYTSTNTEQSRHLVLERASLSNPAQYANMGIDSFAAWGTVLTEDEVMMFVEV